MSHNFGNINSWTRDKLDRIEAYLNAYLVALKNQNFHLEYIDAFAGTGYVSRKVEMPAQNLFESNELVNLKELIDGSARIALQTQPGFSKYRFIEKHRGRCEELEKLKTDFPSRSELIEIIHGEANNEVQRLCNADWIASRRRGVMLLDPYGTQVTWETVKAIADTRAIDLWVLFPIGTVNRLLNRNGKIREARKRRLDILFGEDKWFSLLYKRSTNTRLFESEVIEDFKKVTDPFPLITDYYLNRLRELFPQVAEKPLIMKNSSNTPIFLLCFASANPKGGPIAVKIANHILRRNKDG
jgi:three-Cys-motif partner protein